MPADHGTQTCALSSNRCSSPTLCDVMHSHTVVHYFHSHAMDVPVVVQPRPEDQMSPAQTAAEATKRMLDSKRLSNKINYEVLDNLFNTDSVTQG